mgnify:CR=1 FL=1
MGFFVSEPIVIDDYKVNPTNCYVTIRATYQQNKAGFGGPVGMLGGAASASSYCLSARYYVYAAKDATKALKEDWFSLNCDAVPANPLGALYAAIVADKFPGKTITADL